MNKIIVVTAMALMLFFAVTSAVSAATVTRDLPSGTVDAGADFDVTISQTGFFVVGTVTEVLPTGYSYVIGSATGVDSANYNFQTRELELVIDAGNSSVTYEVKAGASDGTFTGTYATVDASADPDLGDVTGDSIVTITPINGEVTVTRNFPSGSLVDSGTTFVVEISQSGFINEGTVSEVIPQGFTYIIGSASNVVSANYHSGTRTLELTIDSAIGTASYAVVAGAADGTFTGTYVTEDSVGSPISGDVTGDEDITITTSGDVVVTRDLPAGTVDAGAQFEVSISQSGFFVVGTVTEVLPLSYTYVPGSATNVDDAVYDPDTRILVLTIDSETDTASYQVTAGLSDGTFAGTFSTIDSQADPVAGDVGGDETVTITPNGDEVIVTRDLPAGMVDAGAQFGVSLSPSNFFVVGTVTEVLPVGYSYVDGSATNVDSAGYDPVTRTLELVIDSETSTATYQVIAGNADGVFTGTFSTIDSSADPILGAVTGDDTVTIIPIGEVTVTRNLPDTAVNAGTQFGVSISQNGFFMVGTVTEVLPVDYSYVTGSATGVDNAVYDPDTRTLVLTIDSETSSVSYSVTAGVVDGVFSGTYATIDSSADPVLGNVEGDDTVTISIGEDVTVIRGLPDNTVDPGDLFEVSLTQTGFFVVGTVTEVLPVGYSYVGGSATNVDSADYDPVTRTLELEIDSETSTATYQVITGTQNGLFTGTFATIDAAADPVQGDVTGDNTVTVSINTVSVTRDLPANAVNVGAEFDVSIIQTGFFMVGTVTEVLPQGYAYVEGSATGVDNASYDADTRTLVLTIDSETSTVTYSVTAGTTDGVFTGAFATIDASADPVYGVVTGDDTVTIIPDVLVIRDLPAIAVDTGSEFTVSITQTGFFVVGTVSEVLPVGYSYVNGSATNVDDVDYDSTTRTLNLTIDAAAGTVTYKVTAGTNDGTFVGTYATVDESADPLLGDVTGDDQVAICHWRDLWYGDGIITTIELQDAIHHWLEDELVAGCHLLTTEELQEIIALWLSS